LSPTDKIDESTGPAPVDRPDDGALLRPHAEHEHAK